MGKPSIKLYVDTISPFGYLGFWMVRNSPVFKSIDVEYVPILLGGLFKQCNNTPPLTIKNKDKWINRERLLWAKQFDIPMREKTPPGFPSPFINAMRLLCALHLKSPEKVGVAFDMISNAVWAPHALPSSMAKPASDNGEYNVNSPEDLTTLLSPDNVLGKELAAEVIKAMTGPEAKAALMKNTTAAFEDGAFGLPYYMCENEKGEKMGFWGFDHLGQVANFMGLDGLSSVGGSKRLKPLL